MHRDNRDFEEDKYNDSSDLSSNLFRPYDSIFIPKLIRITLESENISLVTSKITNQFEVYLKSNRFLKNLLTLNQKMIEEENTSNLL